MSDGNQGSWGWGCDADPLEDLRMYVDFTKVAEKTDFRPEYIIHYDLFKAALNEGFLDNLKLENSRIYIMCPDGRLQDLG